MVQMELLALSTLPPLTCRRDDYATDPTNVQIPKNICEISLVISENNVGVNQKLVNYLNLPPKLKITAQQQHYSDPKPQRKM